MAILRTRVVLPALALAALAGCATVDANIGSRRTGAALPPVHRLVLDLDMPGLFGYNVGRPTALDDSLTAPTGDKIGFPEALARGLARNLEEHRVAARVVYTGFAETAPRAVEALVTEFGADAVLQVTTSLYRRAVNPTWKDILFSPESSALRSSDNRTIVDLDLTIPSPADPGRKAWTAYLQTEPGSSGMMALADTASARIVRQLVADGVVAAGP